SNGLINGGTIDVIVPTNATTGIAALTSWRLHTTAGTNQVTAVAAGVAGTLTFTATGTVGAANLAHSTVVAGAGALASGATTAITVTLKDVNDNQLAASGGTVVLATNIGTLSAITNNNDGTYSATFT